MLIYEPRPKTKPQWSVSGLKGVTAAWWERLVVGALKGVAQPQFDGGQNAVGWKK